MVTKIEFDAHVFNALCALGWMGAISRNVQAKGFLCLLIAFECNKLKKKKEKEVREHHLIEICKLIISLLLNVILFLSSSSSFYFFLSIERTFSLIQCSASEFCNFEKKKF